MYNIVQGSNGQPLATESTGVKVRIIRTFQRPNESMADVNKEIRDLTPADIDWFREEFNRAGYLTT